MGRWVVRWVGGWCKPTLVFIFRPSVELNKIEIHKVMKHSDRKDFKCNLCDYKGAIAKYLRRLIDAVNEFVPHPGL